MKLARTAICIMAVVLLFGGFLAYLAAALQGDAVGYAKRVDVPAVRILASIIVFGAIALSFIPDREPES